MRTNKEMNNHKEKKRYLRPMVEELEMCGGPCLLKGSYTTDKSSPDSFNAMRRMDDDTTEEYGDFTELK